MLIINRHGSVLCGICRSSDLEHHAEGCTWYESNKGAIRLFNAKKQECKSQHHEYGQTDAEFMQDFWISRGKHAYVIGSDACFYVFNNIDGECYFIAETLEMAKWYSVQVSRL